jgi:vacuolar protein sorting-associated protein 13B
VSFSRLKLSTKEVGKGWSGEIPLKEIISNSRPWLVKVPSSINKGFSSFWVRIIREDIAGQQQSQPGLKTVVPQRVLVVVWPLFMMQSCLSCDTTAQEATTGQLFTVIGKGKKRELEFSGTHEDDHTLTLER